MNELQQFNKYKKTIFRYFFDFFDSSFFCFSSSYVFCMHFVSFHSSNLHKVDINFLLLDVLFFLKFCEYCSLRILFNKSQIICFESVKFAYYEFHLNYLFSNINAFEKISFYSAFILSSYVTYLASFL